MKDDWIDKIKQECDEGYRRPLLPSQHNAVNSRYAGLTCKHCPVCEREIDDAQTYCSVECMEEASDEQDAE